MQINKSKFTSNNQSAFSSRQKVEPFYFKINKQKNEPKSIAEKYYNFSANLNLTSLVAAFFSIPFYLGYFRARKQAVKLIDRTCIAVIASPIVTTLNLVIADKIKANQGKNKQGKK